MKEIPVRILSSQVAQERTRTFMQKRSTYTLLLIVTACFVIDTITPVDLPFLVDETILGLPAFAAMNELWKRLKNRRKRLPPPNHPPDKPHRPGWF